MKNTGTVRSRSTQKMVEEIPKWVVPGAVVWAWLPQMPHRYISHATRWQCKILSVIPYRSRRNPTSLILSVPTKEYMGRTFVQHYPTFEEFVDHPTENGSKAIPLKLRHKGRLSLEQHARPSCSERVEISAGESTFACKGCNAPSIPATLAPGSLKHATHENCTIKLMSKHLQHRNPNKKVSTMNKAQLYKALFGVEYPEGVRRAAMRFKKEALDRTTDAQKVERRQVEWEEYVSSHYDPLYRLAMKSSGAHPHDKRRNAWGALAKQSKQQLVTNLIDAGYPSNYVDVLMGGVEFPARFTTIAENLSARTCQTCHCHVMEGIAGFEPPSLNGILKKSVQVGPVSFETIRCAFMFLLTTIFVFFT